METGTSVPYAHWNFEDRGKLYIGAQEAVNEGIIFGEHSSDIDL